MIRRIPPVLGRYDAVVLASSIWFLAKFLRYAFPPLFEELKLAFGVSNAAVGTAFTGFMLVYALLQFPSGILGDRFGGVRVISAGVLVAAGGAIVVAMGGPFVLLVGAMLVMGAGTGAHKTVAITLLSQRYPARAGRTMGVFDTAGTFGGVVAPITVAVVLGLGFDWRIVFLLGGIVGLALAAGFFVRVPGRNPDGQKDGSGSESRATPLRAYAGPFLDRRTFAFVIVTLGFGFAYNGIVAFLPLYLVTEVGLASATASLLYSLLFVVSVVQLLTGELADRIGRLRIITATLSLSALSLSVLLFAPAWEATAFGVPIAATVSVVGLGVGSHGFRPVRGVHLAAVLPDSLAGGGIGAVRTALMGAGAVAPAVVGFLVDRAGFRVAFGLLFGSLLVSVVVAIGLLADKIVE